MSNVSIEELNELLAQCATEQLNEWLADCSTEDIAVMLCVANTWKQARKAKHSA